MDQVEKVAIPEDAGKELKKKRYHHGDLRAGLIEATRRIVEEKGADAFSVAEACRVAGVSSAAPYKHFKDKNEMLVAMVMEGMERHRRNMLASIEGIPEGSPDRITALGREYIRFALAEPALFRLKFGGFTDGLDDERLQKAGEGTFAVVQHEVAKCLGEDGITQKVKDRSFAMWAMVHGMSFLLHDEKLREMGGELEVDALLADLAPRMLS